MNLFNVQVADFIPVMSADTEVGKETVNYTPIFDGSATYDGQETYHEEEDVQDY